MAYSSEFVEVWTSNNISNMTSEPPVHDVAFINMHIQPSKDLQLHDVLQAMAGNISGHLVASQVPQTTGSGDVHVMVVDHGEQRLYVAFGTTTANGTAYIRKACDAPVLSFDLPALWNTPAPMATTDRARHYA